MKTTCKYCGIVTKPHICPYRRRKYDNNRKDKRLYKTKRWQDTRQYILGKYNGICLWSFYVEGKVKCADEVHHIVEVMENEDLAFDEENLIPLEFYVHKKVHKLYKENKEKVQELLRVTAREYANGDRTVGKYKKYF